MNFFLYPRRRRLGRTAESAFLFAVSVILCGLSVYIPQWSVSFSLKAIPLVIVGFLYGPWVGMANGLVADSIAFVWEGRPAHSMIFLLQTMSMGLFGGLGRMFMGMDWRNMGRVLGVVVGGMGIVYGAIFPTEIPFILLYSSIFYVVWEMAKGKGNKLWGSLLLVFALLIYVSSFGMGVTGSIITNGGNSHILFFKARVYKEFVKLLVFMPLTYLHLRSRYEPEK